jgi:hypothetical protein
VCCWNHSEIESDLLWARYVQPQAASAVRSTFVRLAAAFGAFMPPVDKRKGKPAAVPVYLGPVWYVDFAATDLETPGNMMLPLMLKRLSFQHEAEVRAVITDSPPSRNWSEETPIHRYISVDIERLVESIFVSPVSPDWFYDLVQRVCQRYGIGDRVRRSELAGEPLY